MPFFVPGHMCLGGADRRDIQHRRDYLYVAHAELGALCDDASCRDHGRAAVIVESTAVATLLVRVDVRAAAALGGVDHELEARMQLAQLVVRALGDVDRDGGVDREGGSK